MRFACLYAQPTTEEIMVERRGLMKKKILKNVILDSLFALLIFKMDFDGTRHLNISKLSNNYSQFAREAFLCQEKKSAFDLNFSKT
jgi:hypothetical protein